MVKPNESVANSSSGNSSSVDSGSGNSSTANEDVISVEKELSLEFLIKLVPESFDGDRLKIRSFIKQVDAIFELAKPHQVSPLLLFVKSKIVGKAREQIDIHCNLTSWSEISQLLLSLYQDKKSIDQLLEELNNTKQFGDENVSQFYQRLEDVCSRILAIIHATELDQNKLQGRLLMINDITLNRFVYHTHPQISQMLRYRQFESINSALTAALSEEKALRLSYRSSVSKCKNCGRTNHNTTECNVRPHFQQKQKFVNFSEKNDGQSDVKQCRYCKNLGHTIEECRKRQYNNSKFQVPLSKATPSQSTVSNFQLASQETKPPNLMGIVKQFQEM